MLEDYDIAEWVAQADNSQRGFREAVHTILAAIANDPQLRADMVIKGGILLAVRYQSHRYTKDIDFSTSKKLDEIDPDQIKDALNKSFIGTAEELEYELDCRVQSCRVQPANQPDASFPSVKITVGYAYKSSVQHKRLLVNQSPTSISIDYSLNELMPNLEVLDIGQGDQLCAYTLTDLIAEKLRSLLQQKIRNRTRRQDIFDLMLLIEKYPDLDGIEKQGILKSFVEKSGARDITPDKNSLDDAETRERSQKDYLTLADEIEDDLPDFDEIYDAVNTFYKSLPWA
jgi:predicted nucleotidyltransferase component of viral defense system